MNSFLDLGPVNIAEPPTAATDNSAHGSQLNSRQFLVRTKEQIVKCLEPLACLHQVKGPPIGPLLREIVIRMLDHLEYSPEEKSCVVLIEEDDVVRVLSDFFLPYRFHEMPLEAR